MTLVGSRPRYLLPSRPSGRIQLANIGSLLIRIVRSAATGKPSSVMLNARRNYRGYRYLVNDLFELEDDAAYLQNFRRLAVSDAVGIDWSIHRAALVTTLIFVVGTLVMGSALLGYLFTMQSFSLSQLGLLIVFGLVHTAIVLPGLARAGLRALSFRVMLALWLVGAATGIYLLGADVVLHAWQSRRLSFVEQTAVALTLLAGVAVGTWLLALLWEQLCGLALNRTVVRLQPEATIVFELLWVAHMLTKFGNSPMYPQWRWVFVDAIEMAARAMERGMSRRVELRDFYMRSSIQERFAGSARALRNYQREIVLEEPGTRAKLIDELAGVAKSMISQRYAELPYEKTEESTRRQVVNRVIRFRLLGLTASLGVAVLPLVAVNALKLAPLSLPEATSGALTTLAAVWFLVKIIALIDPEYRESLSDARAMLPNEKEGRK
jgi:hypothetical protein